ncbi:hypothetical protein QBC45DRAFT_53133 [Copromyces sp. CBS 386.78]|nr:hypothetical protein QBC45DRAFT_53133 [Copromyces sp. CBS 386.78]
MQLPTTSLLLLLLGGGPGIAAPIVEECHSPHILCFDAVNRCGVIYSGCYDKCKPDTRPQAPACPPPKPLISSIKTITKTSIATVAYTGTGLPPILPTITQSVSLTTQIVTITTNFGTKDNCSTRTVCIDYVDNCGQTYGGCVPDCKPWPTFSAPACPPRPTTTATVTGRAEVGAGEVTGV